MIPIVQEPDDLGAYGAEHCCFCRKLTRTWTNLPDRKSGEQVACCPGCAWTRQPLQVPSKRAWCDLEQVREWALGVVRPWQEHDPKWRRVLEGIKRRRERADLCDQLARRINTRIKQLIHIAAELGKP